MARRAVPASPASPAAAAPAASPARAARPTTPAGHLSLGDALGRSEPLARLLQRLQESRERFEHISPLLPPGLQQSVRPGPIDDDGWLLLVAHGAAAAKLRQLLPRLEDALRAAGWPARPIKLRVQAPAP